MRSPVRTYFFRLAACVLWLMAAPALLAQPKNNNPEELRKVIVVQMDPSAQIPADKCWESAWDGKSKVLERAASDTIFDLERFMERGDLLFEGHCFIPQLRIIYREYTYVLSYVCARGKRYLNAKPYVASAREVPMDFVFTAQLFAYLDRLQIQYFHNNFSKYFEHHAADGMLPMHRPHTTSAHTSEPTKEELKELELLSKELGEDDDLLAPAPDDVVLDTAEPLDLDDVAGQLGEDDTFSASELEDLEEMGGVAEDDDAAGLDELEEDDFDLGDDPDME